MKRWLALTAFVLILSWSPAAVQTVPLAAQPSPAPSVEPSATPAPTAEPTPTTVIVATAAPAPPPVPAAPTARPVVAAPTAAPQTPSPEPTPWNPPLILCPTPVGENHEGISFETLPPLCTLEHVYGFAAPPGWKAGDPIPPWVKAP